MTLWMWFSIWYMIGLASAVTICYIELRAKGSVDYSLSEIFVVLAYSATGLILTWLAIYYFFEEFGSKKIFTLKLKRKEK